MSYYRYITIEIPGGGWQLPAPTEVTADLFGFLQLVSPSGFGGLAPFRAAEADAPFETIAEDYRGVWRRLVRRPVARERPKLRIPTDLGPNF